MIKVYGVANKRGAHVDVSNTLQGAKMYATKHGFSMVTVRNEYTAYNLYKKVNGKWIDYNEALRLELIEWLSWNDRNGVYTDKDCLAEFGQIATLGELLAAYKNQNEGNDPLNLFTPEN